jgi:hypothetical protein
VLRLGDGKAADWPLIAETLLLCDYPGLAARFRRVPAGQDGNEGQREAEKHEPKHEAVPLDTISKTQVGSSAQASVCRTAPPFPMFLRDACTPMAT